MKLDKIKKVLVANRGEIALRVFSTCREMGLLSVAVYTEEEKSSAHATQADQAFSLGSGPLSQTYLNKQKIIDLARACGAQAIHPGYGFLSENAEFADMVEKAGLIFVGPPGRAMRAMGDKKGSKEAMQKLGVPVIPGYHGDSQDPALLKKEAQKIGVPLLIKASAGGGGKGMRIVEDLKEFDSALDSAKREAMNAFGDERVLLERYITSPRHIEVQVMSDNHGNHLHFFERECSIQRRHQKIVEESPSPALDPQMRQRICETATRITRHIDYRGAGTIEMMFDVDGSFYFLEMNTRLQVEHPVTEMVTGHDLVRLQLLVADGQALPMKQSDLQQRGHAIEVRICAEDPDNDFMPSIGKIHHVGRPLAPNTRLDCGYRDGDEVSISFDPMLAKLIAWAGTRTEAASKLDQALGQVPFLGLTTNRPYLQRILRTPSYLAGKTFTHFVKSCAQEIKAQEHPLDDTEKSALAAALIWSQSYRGRRGTDSAPWAGASVWERLSGLRI